VRFGSQNSSSLLNSFLAPFGWHSDGTATINTTDTS
jgi:hypothetical protein